MRERERERIKEKEREKQTMKTGMDDTCGLSQELVGCSQSEGMWEG